MLKAPLLRGGALSVRLQGCVIARKNTPLHPSQEGNRTVRSLFLFQQDLPTFFDLLNYFNFITTATGFLCCTLKFKKMITSVEEMIERYVSAWNEQSLAAYKTAFAECWAPEALYTDPNFELIKGVDGISELAQKSLEMIPSRTFKILTKPDYHHHVGRYNWQGQFPDGTRDGFDYFEFNDKFQITRLVSFFNL